MSQKSLAMPANQTGINYRLFDTDRAKAVSSWQKGGSAPTSDMLDTGSPWWDDSATPWELNIWNGSAFVTLLTFNPSSGLVSIPNFSSVAVPPPLVGDEGKYLRANSGAAVWDSITGLVSLPVSGDANKVLKATGAGTYGWFPFVVAMISDALTFMKTFLTSADAAAARTAIGAADSTTMATKVNRAGDVMTATLGINGGVLDLYAVDGVHEGGEIQMRGAASFPTAVVDRFDGTWRVYNAADPTKQISMELATGNLTVVGVITEAGVLLTSKYAQLAQNNMFTKGQRVQRTAVSASGLSSLDFGSSNYFKITLDANLVMPNPTGQVEGQAGVIILIQDGSGGRTATWGSNYKFSQGAAPVLTSTANAVDVLPYYVNAAGQILVGTPTSDIR